MPKTEGKTRREYAEDYTQPELRERLKEAIKAGEKGGKAGEWSARKSQMLVREYEAQGGGYRHPKRRTQAQASLTRWTAEDWTTADGKVAIRAGRTKRYLPREVWESLSEEEKAQTERLKTTASKRGVQSVANPEEVREILRHAHARAEKRVPQPKKARRARA